MISRVVEALDRVGLVHRASAVESAGRLSRETLTGALRGAANAVSDVLECCGSELSRERFDAFQEARRICRAELESIRKEAA